MITSGRTAGGVLSKVRERLSLSRHRRLRSDLLFCLERDVRSELNRETLLTRASVKISMRVALTESAFGRVDS